MIDENNKKDGIFVNTQCLSPQESYVCWIDIMGTKNTMLSSFERASNSILRFHASCINATKELIDINVYPLMDGVFITSGNIHDMKEAIDGIYKGLSDVFLGQKYEYQFVIRGSLAYGEISHGNEITKKVNAEISSNNNYKRQLLFGLPMIQAFNSEGEAPPFGVYIHESARTMRKEDKLQGRYYDWCRGVDSILTKQSLSNALCSYFDWCEAHYNTLKMEKNKIEKYKDLVKEYFEVTDKSSKTA